jgi:hypothetical protein
MTMSEGLMQAAFSMTPRAWALFFPGNSGVLISTAF